MKEQNGWKERLLKTGLPLEQSVKNALEGLGIPFANELRFERKNESNREIMCSADVLGECDCGYFDVRLLIECKYRHPGSQWLFTPSSHYPSGRTTKQRVHNVLPDLHPEFRPRDTRLQLPIDALIVGKGVEFKGGNDGYDAEINRAIYQLRYGVHRLIKDYLFGVADGGLRRREKIPVFVPIVCTTAELFVMRRDVGVAEVLAAGVIEEVAECQDSLLLYDKSDALSRNDFRERIAEMHQTARTELERRAKLSNLVSLDVMAHKFSDSPSFFHVVTLDGLRTFVESTLKLFETLPIIEDLSLSLDNRDTASEI